MKTLTDRKIAEQETVTFETQRLAQVTRQQLEQASAMAATQAKVVDAERGVCLAEFQAKATMRKAEGEAKARTVQAEADAMVVTTVGNAEATETKAVGTAKADVIKMKIASMESGNYAIVQVANALAANKIPWSRKSWFPGAMAKGGHGGTPVDVLLAHLVTGQIKEPDARQPRSLGGLRDRVSRRLVVQPCAWNAEYRICTTSGSTADS